MNRSDLLKLMYRLNRIFTILNKYFYILPILSYISSIKDNKYYKSINKVLKLIILINIVLGVSLVILFTDFISPINNVNSIYNDLLEPYIEIIKHLWTKSIQSCSVAINKIFSLQSSAVPSNPQLETVIQESITKIQTEVKIGVKTGIQEALEDILNEYHSESNLLKQLALVSAVGFFVYFIFILPGGGPGSLDYSQYNWINQSLIELKIMIKDLIVQPGGEIGKDMVSASVQTREMVETGVQTILEVAKSPVSPISDGGTSTITPNTPITVVKTISEYVESSTQTSLEGVQISRTIQAFNLVTEGLSESTQSKLKILVNGEITKITD